MRMYAEGDSVLYVGVCCLGIFPRRPRLMHRSSVNGQGVRLTVFAQRISVCFETQ